jgi:hypothetical protein
MTAISVRWRVIWAWLNCRHESAGAARLVVPKPTRISSNRVDTCPGGRPSLALAQNGAPRPMKMMGTMASPWRDDVPARHASLSHRISHRGCDQSDAQIPCAIYNVGATAPARPMPSTIGSSRTVSHAVWLPTPFHREQHVSARWRGPQSQTEQHRFCLATKPHAYYRAVEDEPHDRLGHDGTSPNSFLLLVLKNRHWTYFSLGGETIMARLGTKSPTSSDRC